MAPTWLPDRLAPGIRLLFVGINPGLRSAALGHHYAGHSNRFWKALSHSGLTPTPVSYADDVRLPAWGIGLTNLIARPTAGIDDLTMLEFAQGRRRLEATIRRYRPQIVAILGISVARALFPSRKPQQPRSPAQDAPMTVGWQTETLGLARIYVLPNPSGRNARYGYRVLLKGFRDLHRALHCH